METVLAPGTGRATVGLARVTAWLLACGLASSVLYVLMILLATLGYPGYRTMSQTISELSAIGAPSRPLWVTLGVVHDLLLIAFGFGVRRAAGSRRVLRIAGVLLVAQGLVGFVWAPMHQRGAAFTMTDVLHIVFTFVTLLLMMGYIGLAAAALGRRFRLYSIASILLIIVFGAMAGMQGPRIAADLPTPWVGLLQRVNIAAFVSWIAVFAVALLREARRVTGPGAWDRVAPGGVRR